ncbi:MAG TPA: ABC transporter substrate-binding protein [Chloroflexota bacterium]|jgi:ABC-type nitrate/sulfonate/bicarbonate transport system substrate-binding protein
MTSRYRGAWLVLAASLGLLTACSQPAAPAGGAAAGDGAAPPAAATQPPPRQEIKVVNVAGINGAPYQLALARGYYAEHGLDVSLLEMPAATGVKAAIAGDFQFVTAAGAAVAAALNDAPIRVVFIAAPPPLFALYSQPSIGTVAELRGKRIGISSRGSAPEVIARIVLERAGVDPDADVTWVVVGAGAARTQALVAGAVDAAVLSSPSDVLARRAGFRELSNFAREFRAGGAAGAAAPTDFLQRNPDTARRWIEASIQGLRYLKADRDGAIHALAPIIEVDEDVMADVYDIVSEFFGTTGYEDDAALTMELDLNKRSLGLDKDVRLDQVFDFSLAREASSHLDQTDWRP